MKRLLAILSFLMLMTSVCFGDVPKLSSHVTDLTANLKPNQISSLETKLSLIEKSNNKHPQIAFLLVPTIPNDDIEKFANDVFHENKLGQKDLDNGLLIVIAPTQRKMRVEVGYGLEEYIPDGVAKDITESMKPFLRTQNYQGAILTAILNIEKRLPKDSTVVNEPKQTQKETLSMGTFILLTLGGVALWGVWKMLTVAFKSDVPKKKPQPSTVVPKASSTPNNVYPRYSSPEEKKNSGPGFGTGLATGMIVESLLNSSKKKDDDDSYSRRKKRRDEDDSYSSSSSGYRSSWSDSGSSSSWDSGSSSSSSDSWSGGGGDSGGGGSSDSY